MMAAVGDANRLRHQFAALRYGWASTLHEDRPNGVMAYERAIEGEPRVVVVVNAGRSYWQGSEYGVWVGSSGTMEEVYCTQVRWWEWGSYWLGSYLVVGWKLLVFWGGRGVWAACAASAVRLVGWWVAILGDAAGESGRN